MAVLIAVLVAIRRRPAAPVRGVRPALQGEVRVEEPPHDAAPEHLPVRLRGLRARLRQADAPAAARLSAGRVPLVPLQGRRHTGDTQGWCVTKSMCTSLLCSSRLFYFILVTKYNLKKVLLLVTKYI